MATDIKIERTDSCNAASEKVSEFIKNLPLSNKDNDQLIALMLDHIKEAETGAFEHGFKLGLKITVDNLRK